MSDKDALARWIFDEAVLAAAPLSLLDELAEADRKLSGAQALRASTTPWMEGGNLDADRDANAALAKCQEGRRRCMTALRQSLIDELADDRYFGIASFGSPMAKPRRVSRLAWRYMKSSKEADAETVDEEGKPVLLYNLRIYRSKKRLQFEGAANAEENARDWIRRYVASVPREFRRRREVYWRYMLIKRPIKRLTERAFLRAWRAIDNETDGQLRIPGPKPGHK